MTVIAQVWLVIAVLAAAGAAALAIPRRRLPQPLHAPHGWPVRRVPLQWAAAVRGHPEGMSPLRRGLMAIPVLLGGSVGLQGFGSPIGLSWLLAGVAAVVGWVLLGKVEPEAVRRRREQLIDDLPHACELLGSCLAVGLPLRTAVASVARAMDGPVAEDLQSVNSLIMIGSDEAEAWRSLAEHPQWGQLARDLARSCEYGASLAPALVQHAEQARARRRAAREARARTVGVKSVLPLMVCFLPAFFLIGVVPIVASLVLDLIGQ